MAVVVVFVIVLFLRDKSDPVASVRYVLRHEGRHLFDPVACSVELLRDHLRLFGMLPGIVS